MTSKPTTILIRDLRVGECVSFDGGRIKVCLREKSGRAARLQFEVPEAVGIDKPRQAANDEGHPTPLDSATL
ncbi:hypothetical protein [Pseudacidovorax intermedius]|uniref:hypothetical protein n=1 Tax=Pseudacidovorax intermedius TaxID=433924 RepID=UPI000344D492|nr:hypothetical protein [Pseudacidovorax intermedius]